MDPLSVLTFLCVIFSPSLLVSSQENNVNIVNNSPVYAKIGSNLTLLCQYTLMSGGEVTVIEWYKDGVKFFKQSWYSSATQQKIRWYNRYATEGPGVSAKGAFLGNAKNGPGRPDGNATMVIMNMDNDDKGKYKCEIELEASGTSYSPSDDVVVEINIVPEDPTVTFEPDKTDLVDGDTIVMTCTGNLGSPPGMLSWKRKSRVTWDIQGKPQEQFKIIENKTDGSQVGRIVFNHTFFTSNNDDGAVFRCDASRQSMSQEIISSATRTFKVKGLLVSSQENNVNIVNNSPVYAKIGSNLTLLCQYTLISGGAVQLIEWFKDDVKIFKQSWVSGGTKQEVMWYQVYTGDKPGVSKKGAFLGNAKDDTGGPDGNAGLVIMNVATADKGKYKCEIELEASGVSSSHSDEVDVEINIEPEVPTVTFEPDKTHLTDGDTIVMTCTGNVGSPPGMLSWKRKNGVIWDIQGQPQEQFQIFENKTDGTKVGRIVFNHTFVANEKDTGAVFRCDASRQSMSKKIISSATRAFSFKGGNESGQSDGLIVGVSVGSFLLVLAVVIVVCVIKRRPCPTFTSNRGSAYAGSGNKNSASTVHYKARADDVGSSNGNHNNPDLLVNNHLVDRQGFKNVANRAFEPEETLDDDVREFLERLGFERYVPIFQRELITSYTLAKLTLEDLTGTLGIPLGPSKRMMEKIADMAPYEEAEFQRTNQGDYIRLRDPGYHQLDRSRTGQQGMYSSIQPPLYQRLSNPGDTARAEYSILDQPVYQKTDRQDDHGPHYQPLDYGQYYDDGSSTINRNTGETHAGRQPGQENLDASR